MREVLWRFCNFAVCMLLFLRYREGTEEVFAIDRQYHLVVEAHDLARRLFLHGRASYDALKNSSLHVMGTFMDLVEIMNSEMARTLRGAVIKFYKVKYFHDFTNYVITLEEIIDTIEHCLAEPAEKLRQLREEFRTVIDNFHDVRRFDTVHKCREQLPDEVAAAHCVLHQAVLFNETMHESLLLIVEIKTNQYVRKINASLFEVQKCLNAFVPNFFEQLLVDAYTDKCGYLKVVNASIEDLIKDKWRGSKETLMFPKKWTPLVEILKHKTMKSQSLLHTLRTANLTTNDVIKNCIHKS